MSTALIVFIVVVLVLVALALLLRGRLNVRGLPCASVSWGSGARMSQASIVRPQTRELNRRNSPSAEPVWPSKKPPEIEPRRSLSRSEPSCTSKASPITSSSPTRNADGSQVLQPSRQNQARSLASRRTLRASRPAMAGARQAMVPVRVTGSCES